MMSSTINVIKSVIALSMLSLLLAGCAGTPVVVIENRFPQVMFLTDSLRQDLFVQSVSDRFNNGLREIDVKIVNSTGKTVCFSYNVEWSEQGFAIKTLTNRKVEAVLSGNSSMSIQSIAPKTSANSYIVRVDTTSITSKECARDD